MKNLFNRFVREDAGQDLIEYALLTGIIAAGLVVTLPAIGTKILTKFNTINGWLP
jgi:pilus assembly protein Flp/PilA